MNAKWKRRRRGDKLTKALVIMMYSVAQVTDKGGEKQCPGIAVYSRSISPSPSFCSTFIGISLQIKI